MRIIIEPTEDVFEGDEVMHVACSASMAGDDLEVPAIVDLFIHALRGYGIPDKDILAFSSQFSGKNEESSGSE